MNSQPNMVCELHQCLHKCKIFNHLNPKNWNYISLMIYLFIFLFLHHCYINESSIIFEKLHQRCPIPMTNLNFELHISNFFFSTGTHSKWPISSSYYQIVCKFGKWTSRMSFKQHIAIRLVEKYFHILKYHNRMLQCRWEKNLTKSIQIRITLQRKREFRSFYSRINKKLFENILINICMPVNHMQTSW